MIDIIIEKIKDYFKISLNSLKMINLKNKLKSLKSKNNKSLSNNKINNSHLRALIKYKTL